MQEEFNLFPNGAALEALCLWSDSLKSFEQRLEKYYARSEARLAAFDYIQALLCPVERKNGWQMAETCRICQSISLAALVGKSGMG